MSDQPTNVVDTLRMARAKIADPQHWTKGALAKKSKLSRDGVNLSDPEANAWCALGALRAVDGPFEIIAVVILAQAITGYRGAGERAIYLFNDKSWRRHRDVMRAYDKAIELAEQRSTPQH